jgi:acrylyl-CoA reductase (NADPH) / 3-hydroxypropionyl-CoA dehydratase / 3-hydroxypropionyl-CoA synthetase
MTITISEHRHAGVPQAQTNPVRTLRDWEAQRAAAIADPGAFHGAIAKRQIHWFVPAQGLHGAWLGWDDASRRWTGWEAGTGGSADLGEGALAARLQPRSHRTAKAAFNEVDRHVLAGHGSEAAFLFEGDRWDMSQDGGRGAPVEAYAISRKRCCWKPPSARWRCARWA